MKKLQEFFYSVWYLILLSITTLVVWSLHLENYGVPAVLGLMFFFFLFSKDTMPTVPLLMNGLFMVSQTNWSFADAPLYIYLTPIAIIMGMVIHIFKYRVNIFRGKMLLGIGIMVLAMALSTINAEEVTIYYLFYISIGLLYAFIYMFYRNTFDRDHTAYLMKMMAILGILIVVEIVIYYVNVDDIYFALETKSINLGWGISNYIATYLIIFSVVSLYYSFTSKQKVFWLLVGLLEIVSIVFTESRGGIMAIILLLPFIIFRMFRKSKERTILLYTFLLFCVILLSVIFYFSETLFSLFFRFENLLFDDSGRYEIYLDAINKFISHPLFGAGLFAREGNKDYTMYHNMILHTAATLGIIGVVGLFEQLKVQFAVLLRKNTEESRFLLFALLGAYIHSMVDNIYYMPQFMIIMLVIVSVSEFTFPSLHDEHLM